VRDIPAAVTRASVERFPGRGLLPPDAVTGALAVALWGVTVGIGLARRRSEGAIRTDALAAVSLFAILHYAAYAFWLWTGGEERYRLYYFLPQWMAFAMGLGAVAGGWNRRVLRCGFATMIFLAMAVHLILAVRDREAYQDVSDEPMTEGFIYGWVRETLPEDAILGARDAGKLGWFAGRPVVNLDGLINDQRLVAAIRDGREEEYVFESPIDYLFYSPWMVEGFDPEDPGSRPDRPVARMLAQLDRRPDCRVRRLPGDPAYWAVFKITRSDR